LIESDKKFKLFNVTEMRERKNEREKEREREVKVLDVSVCV
jgi:hypothetical protein